MTTQAGDADLMKALGAGAQDPAGSATPPPPPPTSGQPAPGSGNAGDPPPGNGQPGGTTGAASAGASAAAGESEEEKIQKQIRNTLGLKEKEPDTVDYWRAKHGESSKEAKRLAKALKDREARIAQSGLKFLETDDGKYELVPTENFQEVTKLEKGLGAKILKSLKNEEKDLVVENPDEYADLIARKAVETFIASRPAPTAKEAFVKMSDEDINAVHDEIVQRKGTDGQLILKDYATFEPYIKAMLEDSAVPKDFVRFMKSSAANYEFGLKSLYNIVAQSAAPLIATLQDARKKELEKKEKARTDPSLTTEGAGAGAVSASAQDEAKYIAAAKPQW